MIGVAGQADAKEQKGGRRGDVCHQEDPLEVNAVSRGLFVEPREARSASGQNMAGWCFGRGVSEAFFFFFLFSFFHLLPTGRISPKL
jgi:hypothetical protein